MRFSAESVAAYEALSSHNRQFLQYVENNPACLESASFAALDPGNSFVPYPLQPWPTFVKRHLVEEMARANLVLSKLIQSIPVRVFQRDVARIAEFYHLDRDYVTLLLHLLNDSDYMDGLLARGDYVITTSGLQCLEMNMGSNLGGWKSPVWAEMYKRVPHFSRFVEEAGICYQHRDTVQLMLSHVIESARRKRLVGGQDFNVGFVVPPDNRSGPEVDSFVNQEFQRGVERHGLQSRGEVIVCDYPDLELVDNCLYTGGKRIHVLVEHYDGRVDRQVFRCLLAGTLNVHNGPITDLLASKRNLALLSELQDSELFSAEERHVLENHLPWTRMVKPGFTDFLGERIHLPTLLKKQQHRLVLKPANSSQGRGVHVGKVVSEELWAEVMQQGLTQEGTWIVQEYLESLPYPYQYGESGSADHDLVWGLFSFGEIYGGGFLRMMPKGGSGIVNAAQGASEGVIMEVEE